MTEPRQSGRRSAISDSEIKTLMDKGMSTRGIALHFTALGRPITQQGMSLRVRKIREGDQDRSKYILPWAVRVPDHARGWVYNAVVAYGKMRGGRGVTPEEMRLARELEQFLAEQEAVIVYDHGEGFMLRGRRAGDTPSLLQTEK